MLKKILPAVTGAIGFAIGGPMGASIGAGLGSAIRGDNPANIATSALMGYGLGSLGASAGLIGGQGLGALGTSAQAMVAPNQSAALASQQGAAYGAGAQAGAKAAEQTFLQKAGQFIKDKPFTAGALGLGAIGALGAMDEEDEGASIAPPPEPGSIMPLDLRMPDVAYASQYGSAAPTYRSLAEGGETNFPRKVGQIDGPGTEKSDDIPAMLSDGEFVMTAQAVRGLGALNGANKDDKLEQRRKGAKMMYEMMDKFESKVA